MGWVIRECHEQGKCVLLKKLRKASYLHHKATREGFFSTQVLFGFSMPVVVEGALSSHYSMNLKRTVLFSF
jgi:hypothetical protein